MKAITSAAAVVIFAIFSLLGFGYTSSTFHSVALAVRFLFSTASLHASADQITLLPWILLLLRPGH
jgi:hypothetical protein